MLTWIREKFGTVLIGVIIGFITFVFIFYGIFSPKSTRGLHEGAVAGTVNGERISIPEFSRELNRRLEFFRQIAGGKVSDEQLKAFHLKERVFDELVNRKLIAQEAERTGRTASDEEVRDQIRKIPAFQKNGQFDPILYRQVLEANNFTAAGFERSMREDLSIQEMNRYFRDRALVSDEEIKREFLRDGDKREIKYVVLTMETGRKGVKVGADELKKFLADPAKVNLAKSQFELEKDRKFKGKTFEQVRDDIVRDILAGDHPAEARQTNEKLAADVEKLLRADKSSDAKVNALLKPYGVDVKNSGWINREAQYLQGAGDPHDLLADAFAAKSPIDPKQGGAAKKYSVGGSIVIGLVSGSEQPNLAKLSEAASRIRSTLISKKQNELMEGWIKGLLEHAKIERNKAVLGEDDEGARG